MAGLDPTSAELTSEQLLRLWHCAHLLDGEGKRLGRENVNALRTLAVMVDRSGFGFGRCRNVLRSTMPAMLDTQSSPMRGRVPRNSAGHPPIIMCSQRASFNSAPLHLLRSGKLL